jgi:hypothetical protein
MGHARFPDRRFIPASAGFISATTRWTPVLFVRLYFRQMNDLATFRPGGLLPELRAIRPEPKTIAIFNIPERKFSVSSEVRLVSPWKVRRLSHSFRLK